MKDLRTIAPWLGVPMPCTDEAPIHSGEECASTVYSLLEAALGEQVHEAGRESRGAGCSFAFARERPNER